MNYEMKSFNQIALDTYAELAKEAGWTQAFKKGTKTPWQDLKLDEGDPGPDGILAPLAAHVLMKVMYAARMYRLTF